MNKSFKVAMVKGWSVLDDRIEIGHNEVIPLTAVKSVSHEGPSTRIGNGVFRIVTDTGTTRMLFYGYKDLGDIEEVTNYISSYCEKNKPKEYRMRCNVCGNVFCYTETDLRKNLQHAKDASSEIKLGALTAFGSTLESQSYINRAENKLNKIVDYGKCPKCNSTNISEIGEEEFANQASFANNTLSPADELKKFKELLDSGIITQEEFDAKKKQLLGL